MSCACELCGGSGIIMHVPCPRCQGKPPCCDGETALPEPTPLPPCAERELRDWPESVFPVVCRDAAGQDESESYPARCYLCRKDLRIAYQMWFATMLLPHRTVCHGCGLRIIEHRQGKGPVVMVNLGGQGESEAGDARGGRPDECPGR